MEKGRRIKDHLFASGSLGVVWRRRYCHSILALKRNSEDRLKPLLSVLETMQIKPTEYRGTSSKTGEGPVTSALLNALSRRVDSLNQLMAALRDQRPPEEELKARAAQCVAMAKDINELVNWIYPPRRPLGIVEATEFAREMRDDCGLTEDDLTWIFEMARKKERGRPAKTRQVYIKALEIKVSDPTKSWMVLARQLCHCGRPQHDRKCSDNIRRGVVFLKKFLRKYDIRIEDGE
jgi:hypothetical protein